METLEGEKSLSFYCKTSPSFKKKFGIFSLYKAHFPCWLEKILLSIEYIQILSLTILIHPSVFQVSDSNSKNPILFEIVVDFLKLANPSYLLSFTHSDKTTISVLCIILGYMFFKYLALLYAIYISSFNKEPNYILKYVWRCLFKFQGRITCCFITSFWIRTIVSVSNDSFSIQGISSGALVTISVIFMVLEYLLSFLLETQFCDFIPTKGFLSAKNNEMQIITLLQKFVLQIIQLFAYNNFSASIWVCIVLNLMFSIIREYRIFSTLPLYDYEALLYQGALISIVLSLNIVHCIQQALADSAEYSQESDIKLLIILWFFTGIMSWKLCTTFITQTYIRLLTGKEQRKTPEILLHKVFATKYLVENRMIPTTDSVKSDIKHLLGVVQSLNIYEIFNIQPDQQGENSCDIHDKEERTRIFLKYLEDLTHLFPKNPLIKLNLAYCIYKSTGFHAKIIKTISQRNENIWSSYHMSSVLLLHDLQRTTDNNEQENISMHSLNIKKFLESQLLMEDLQNEILRQTELSKQICHNIVQETANIETIYQNAQIIHQIKQRIQDKMAYLVNHIPDHYFHPYQIYAEYSLFLNYSIKEYYKYCEIYSRKSLKFTKELEINNLCEENIYQENNSFLILSADRLENICIVYCTKSLQTICGLDRAKYNQGIPISKLFPPGLRSYYDELFKEIFEKGHSDLASQVIHTYLYHQEGYLVEADIFTRIHPYIGRQLYVDMILRPYSPSGEDLILVNENGKIEGVSKSISQFLKIENLSSMQTTNTIHIKQISEDLAQLNNAFNIIQEKNDLSEKDSQTPQSPKKKNSLFSFSSAKFKLLRYSTETPRLDYIRATELYDRYTSGKKFIQLQGTNTDIPFKCKISRLNFHDLNHNLIKLEKASRPISLEKLEASPRSLHLLPISLEDEDLEERIGIEQIPSHRYRTMTTKEITSPEYVSTIIKDYDENIVSPTTSSRLLLKSGFSPTRRKQRSPTRTVSFNFDNLILPPIPTIPKLEAKQIPKDPPRSNDDASESTHESSKISQISAVFKTFERAITSRSHEKSFNFLCLIFYGVILITLISEIIIKNVLDKTMNSLVVKTDLLNYAQLRTYQTCRMHNIARGSILQIAGIVSDTDLNVPNRQLKGNLETMLSALKVEVQANDGILNNINNENDEIKQMLFQKDINITGNAVDPTDPKYQLITNFQHVDIVTNALMVLKNLTTLISTAAARTFAFLANNLPNDFLAKNEEIIKVFRASVKKQKDSLQTIIKLSVVVLPLLLSGIVSLLIVIIWKQYTKEKKYFLAFLKLDPSKVQHILENLKVFQKKILNQEKFEDDLVPKLIYKLEHSAQSYHKTHDSKVIRHGKMQRRYFLYIFQILFYISILIIIVIVNYALITKATKRIYRKQEQIQYANDISMTVSVTFIAEVDAFVTNNTNYIMRQRPFDLFKTGIRDVEQIQTNLYKEFQEEDGEYDPEVKTILFEEISCDHFIAGPYTFCNSLLSLGQTMKMVSILTLYKNMLDIKYAQYLAVDKSSLANMIAVATTQVSYLQASSAVTSAYAQLINQAISKKLAASIDDIYDLGAAILIVFSLTLVVVSLLIWFQILTKVKEVNNDFKKVLAVLPANIILSSFLLKTFLNRTSNIIQKL